MDETTQRREFWPQWLKEQTRTAEEVRKDRRGETVIGHDLDGPIYGDGTVSKSEGDGGDEAGPTVEDVTKHVDEEFGRDDPLAHDVLGGEPVDIVKATTTAEGPAPGISVEDFEAAMRDQRLSQKEVLLEIRDTLREAGAAVTGANVSKEAGGDGDSGEGGASADEGDPGLIADVEDLIEDTRALAEADEPDREKAEAICDRMEDLTERLEEADLTANQRKTVRALGSELVDLTEQWAEEAEAPAA